MLSHREMLLLTAVVLVPLWERLAPSEGAGGRGRLKLPRWVGRGRQS